VRVLTTQFDTSIPPRELSALEKSVQAAALRALQQYLLGEMDFVETAAPSKPAKRDGEEGTASEPTRCPT